MMGVVMSIDTGHGMDAYAAYAVSIKETEDGYRYYITRRKKYARVETKWPRSGLYTSPETALTAALQQVADIATDPEE